MSQRIPAQQKSTLSAESLLRRSPRRIVARAASVIAPLGLSLVLLAGCGSSSSNVPDDRQFASGAKTASVEHTTPTLPSNAPTEAAGGTDNTGQTGNQQATNPLSTRGAPDDAFTWNETSVTVFSVSADAPSITTIAVELAPGEVVRDVTSSPSGDRLAVLTSDALWSPESLRLAIYGRDGAVIGLPVAPSSIEATPVSSPSASPIATPAGASDGDGTGARLLALPSTLAWSPSGDQIVANVAGRSVVVLDVSDSGPTVREAIAIPTSVGSVAGAWMSPRQDNVLLVLDDGAHGRAIATIALEGSDRRAHVVWPGTDERTTKSVRDVAWMPDGTGLVFTTESRSASGSGNLSMVTLSTLEPKVLATSGRAGPSARIGTFAISPDGKAIAYSLETPSGDGWIFHSLWVRSIRDGSSLEISSANGAVVSAPVWTSEGLVWEQSQPDGTRSELVLAREDGTSVVIANREDTGWVVAGTPEASPQASPPVASPVASPAVASATPGASPAASPAG